MNDGLNGGLEKGIDISKALGLEKDESFSNTEEGIDESASQIAEELAPENLSTKEKSEFAKLFLSMGRPIGEAIGKVGKRIIDQKDKTIKNARDFENRLEKGWKDLSEIKPEEIGEKIKEKRDKYSGGKFTRKTERVKKGRLVMGCLGALVSIAVCSGSVALVKFALDLGKTQRELEEAGIDVPAEQQRQEIANEQEQIFDADYLRYAKEGLSNENGYFYQGLGVPSIDNPLHVSSSDVQIQAAMRGASWIFAMYPDKTGALHINDLLVEKIAGQLGVNQVDLKTEWPRLNADPAYALQYLQVHGANTTVVNFYKCTTDVYNNDLDKASWQDRLPGVQACSIEATKISYSEMESQIDKDFNETTAAICAAIGADFPLIRGAMETVAICGNGDFVGRTIEMVDTYSYKPIVHDSLAANMEMNASGYLIAAMFMLRVGDNLTKGLMEKVKTYLDRNQLRELFNELKVVGEKVFRKTGKEQ